MSWIIVVWSMGAATCLSFAAVNFLVALRARDARANLLFAVSATAAAALTMLELIALRAETAAEYGQALRWMHLAVAVVVIAIVWFVRAYLRRGRLWLAWTITGLRLLVLAPNFIAYPNATFAQITAIESFSLFGERVAVPVGDPNPWRFLIQVSVLLLLIYVVDAAVQAWRRDHRRAALTIGGAIVVAAILSAVNSQLMVLGLLPASLTGLVFLLIVIAMGWELTLTLIQAREVARDLNDSRQRMDLITRAADLGLWEWDIETDEVWMNEGARARIGFDASEPVTFDKFLSRVRREDREGTRKAVLRAMESGHELQVEYRVTGPAGGTRWIAAHGEVVRSAAGGPVRMRGVSIDVTARKRDESELQQQRSSLAQLQRASAVGQLSTVLAHELNQPLGAILRNAETAELLLRNEPPNLEELRAIVADIRSDDERAAAVVARMRALLQRGNLQLERLDLRLLVNEVARLLRAEIHARNATLDLGMPDDLPDIQGDRVHLQQVLLNLLLNGLDAVRDLPEDRRRLDVSARQRGNEEVEVVVRDRGSGFQTEQISDAFEPFVSTKAEGTGLGLSISRTIIEAHGGRIWAENDSQGGATVRFTLQAAHKGARA